jgi:hypothetical protein
MKAVVKSIIKHPFTVIFYLFYLWLVISEICRTKTIWSLKKH